MIKETECKCCKNKFQYDSSRTVVEEDRDTRGYHYYYYAVCPNCGTRVLVEYIN